MRSFLPAFGVLSAFQLLGVVAQGPPACVAECFAEVTAEFTKFTCTSASDAQCLCGKTDFRFGLRDCASAKCGATDADVETFLTRGFCPNVSPTQATSPVAETTAPASTAPAETTAPTSAPPPAETSSAPSPTVEGSTTSAAPADATSSEVSSSPAATTSGPATTESLAESSAESSATSSTETATSAAAAPTNSSSSDGDNAENDKSNKDEDKDQSNGSSSGSGLSTTAKIGIVVGAVVAVILGLVVALCILRKRKRGSQGHQLDISKPLPGAGRVYAPSDDARYEKYGDIEMTTRYEDMLPRQQPRTMV